MGRPLPAPIHGDEEYLAAIYDRLGEILDRLPERAAARQDEGGKVELREPAQPATPEPVAQEPAAPVEIAEPSQPPAPKAGPGADSPTRTGRQPPAKPAPRKRATTTTKRKPKET